MLTADAAGIGLSFITVRAMAEFFNSAAVKRRFLSFFSILSGGLCFNRYQIHSADRTLSRFIRSYRRMHGAGPVLSYLSLLSYLGLLSSYLGKDSHNH